MKINPLTKKIITHTSIILFFLLVSLFYLSPLLDGKIIRQSDVMQYDGMTEQLWNYNEKTGEYGYWNKSAFSGMPTYQIGATEPMHNVFQPIKQFLSLTFMGDQPFGRSRDLGILFVYFIGFYLALLAFNVNPWLSLVGALAFGLGSYNIIILEVGHITKAYAISMMAPILAGMIMAFRKKYLLGSLLFTIALGLQISFNHIQITYYTFIMALVLGITYLVFAVKDKQIKPFLKGICFLAVCSVFVLGITSRHFILNSEYLKYTMRGGSEITVTPNDLYHDNSTEVDKNKGLDIDYAYAWSYGKGETMTLLVPGFYGGGSGEKVSKDSEFYKNFRQKQAPLYWGDQPFTSGPVYFGAIIIFLFVFGLFVVKGPERWWLLIVAIIGILMAWGKNLHGFNEFLFNNLPFYNKFRTPSMSLVIPSVSMVIMAILALKAVLTEQIDKKYVKKSLYISTGIVSGICLLLIVFSSSFSFSGVSDVQMAAQYGENWSAIQEILIADRANLLVSDTWRSLIFILLAASLIWLYVSDILKKQYAIIAILACLVVFDLWSVDKRYLNETNFAKAKSLKLKPAAEDKQIFEYAKQFGDKDYRVFNLSNPFNESMTSAFHNSIGGYSGAKLQRYQDLIDFYLSRIDMNILNMLNARYFIVPDKTGQYQVQRNPMANGNVWFADSVKFVKTANEEILALKDVNLANTAVINQVEFSGLSDKIVPISDETAKIMKEEQPDNNPNYLVYNTTTKKDMLAVFSEIYYKPDWKVYIDGNEAEYFRANYVLRAMMIPAGNHKIEFKNEAPTLHKWDTIGLILSIVLVLLFAVGLFVEYRKTKLHTAKND